jgi:hypothetical protein
MLSEYVLDMLWWNICQVTCDRSLTFFHVITVYFYENVNWAICSSDKYMIHANGKVTWYNFRIWVSANVQAIFEYEKISTKVKV